MTTSSDYSIVVPLQQQKIKGARWQPTIGPEAVGVVERKLPLEARSQVLDSSISILSKSVPPNEVKGSTTGLVVGYVQSGKTLSFTTVMALARDNGFKLIIVIAGTSKPLLKQSTDRLQEDLRISNFDGSPQWNLYTNPKIKGEDRRNIQQTIDRSATDVPTNEVPTVLITVMKQHIHLKNLVALLQKLNLHKVPVLVIDDEADQASLNTLISEGNQSPTYSRILELRSALPNHTFLQYTATPQAPLLINIIDVLSPEFVEVLEPGADYVGGREFFHDRPNLINVIPSEELPIEDGQQVTAPPESLLEALRVFFIGIAAGIIAKISKTNANRSMLVHPARTTEHHKQYYQWIREIFDEWLRVLKLPETDTDRLDLLLEFKEAYHNVLRTVPSLPPFEDLTLHLLSALLQTRIKEVNARSGPTPIIEWKQIYGWILVGGQAMDRGFTVEGLTVTYMPRAPGVGNADTVQQRGRFFGYKRRYLGFCRLYIEQDSLTLFQDYVEHEESMRQELQKIQAHGQPLSAWKRTFILSPELHPCRSSVLQYGYVRGNYADEWFEPTSALAPTDVIEANQKTVKTFIESTSFIAQNIDQYPQAQNHHIARNLSLANVIKLIVDLRIIAANDNLNRIGALLQLQKALENDPNEICTVYHISPNYTRERTVNQNGNISLFQGRSSAIHGEHRYPGDRAFHEEDKVTFQLHLIDIVDSKGNKIAQKVPLIAVWIPRRMEIDWIVQHQP